MFGFNVERRWSACLALAFAILLAPGRSEAAETDNFYLPLDREFADLGDYLELLHTRAIEDAVAGVNNRIERVLQLKDPETRQEEECCKHHIPVGLNKFYPA